MDPPTRIVMAVLCACCTVTAQKPTSSGSGGTNTAVSVVFSGTESGGTLPLLSTNGSFMVTISGRVLFGASTGVVASVASSEPSRIVLQSTPASDASALPAFAGESGWVAPTAVPVVSGLSALAFDGGGADIPCPVRFTNATNIAVQTVILAERGFATNLATLVDGPEVARLRIASDGSVDTDADVIERALTERFRPGQWQVVEIDFDAPAAISDLFFGGSAGRPEWRRNWRGEIAELIGFNNPPDADVRAGVANYLAIRWGFGGCPATDGQRQAAVAAGLDYGRTWGTVLLFR